MWTCELCREQLPGGEVLDHFRLLHPGHDIQILTWPDWEFDSRDSEHE